MNGWIALHRKLLDWPLWTSRGRFSPGQAWVDLLLSAAHSDHELHLGNLKIIEKRGQFLTSQLSLSKRWKWNRKTVVGFLLFLKTDNALDIQTSRAQDSGYTLITILNYEYYQSLTNGIVDNRNPLMLDNPPDNRGTTEGQPRDTHNKGNKGNKNLPDGFVRFWAAYPKKRNQPDALRAFLKINPQNGTLESMLYALEIQKRQPDWIKDSGQYIPYPGTWLNGRMWEDDVSFPITPQNSGLPVAPSMLERKRSTTISES